MSTVVEIVRSKIIQHIKPGKNNTRQSEIIHCSSLPGHSGEWTSEKQEDLRKPKKILNGQDTENSATQDLKATENTMAQSCNGRLFTTQEAIAKDVHSWETNNNVFKTTELEKNGVGEKTTVEPNSTDADDTSNQLGAQIRTLVCGAEVSDVPTRYSIPKLQPHELAVIGTFIDKHVTPGFAYRVRRNGTDEYLFDGKALVLESIGKGYGKRMTFESEDLLDNDNYFWSDSNPDEGFAFSIQVVSSGDEFAVFDSKDSQIATAAIRQAFDEQTIESTEMAMGETVRKVHVRIQCVVKFGNTEPVPKNFQGLTMEFLLRGKAIVLKKPDASRATVTAINNVAFENVGCCTMKCIKYKYPFESRVL